MVVIVYFVSTININADDFSAIIPVIMPSIRPICEVLKVWKLFVNYSMGLF